MSKFADGKRPAIIQIGSRRRRIRALGIVCQKLKLCRVNYKHISGLIVKDKYFASLRPSGFRLYCQVPVFYSQFLYVVVVYLTQVHCIVVFVVLPLSFT